MIHKILIADDEPGALATVGALLRERGYTVWTAGDGREAIQKAVDNQPELIILDIMMPLMDGTEVAMILRNDMRTKDIPVFFLTAVLSPEDEPLVKDNPNPIFAKPVKLYELLEAIKQIGV